MPYTGTELAQWELGKQQSYDERLRALLSMAMAKLQEGGQGQRSRQQMEFAERQAAAQAQQNAIENQFKSVDDARMGKVAEAQIGYYNRPEKVTPPKEPTYDESRRQAYLKKYGDDYEAADRAMAAANRAPDKPDKPPDLRAGKIAYINQALGAYGKAYESNTDPATRDSYARAMNYLRNAAGAVASGKDADFKIVQEIVANPQRVVEEGAWWELTPNRFRPKQGAQPPDKKGAKRGEKSGADSAKSGFTGISGNLRSQVRATPETVSKYMEMYPDKSPLEIVEAIKRTFYA